MFRETKNNWITGEHNFFENAVWLIILLYMISAIIAVFGFFSPSQHSFVENPSQHDESRVIQDDYEIQTPEYSENNSVDQTIKPQNMDTSDSSYDEHNTVKIINLTEEREKRREQREMERAERKQLRLENKLQKQQEREEKRLEKQRLKEEKRLERLNKNKQIEQSTENYNFEEPITQDITQE